MHHHRSTDALTDCHTGENQHGNASQISGLFKRQQRNGRADAYNLFGQFTCRGVIYAIHADHGGGNNSTFANVVISSTGTDIYSCISAAIGSLKGPKHGGANCKVTNMFKAIFHEVGFTTDKLTLKKIANRLLDKDFFDHSGLIYGIGHAIYTKSDPRALLIQQQCEMLAKSKGQEDIYNCIHAFEKVAVEVMKERKGIDVCANVDYYSGYVYSLLGIENDLFTPLFAISRTAGWVSHHLENRQSNRKLIRPANVYVGGMEENE